MKKIVFNLFAILAILGSLTLTGCSLEPDDDQIEIKVWNRTNENITVKLLYTSGQGVAGTEIDTLSEDELYLEWVDDGTYIVHVTDGDSVVWRREVSESCDLDFPSDFTTGPGTGTLTVIDNFPVDVGAIYLTKDGINPIDGYNFNDFEETANGWKLTGVEYGSYTVVLETSGSDPDYYECDIIISTTNTTIDESDFNFAAVQRIPINF